MGRPWMAGGVEFGRRGEVVQPLMMAPGFDAREMFGVGIGGPPGKARHGPGEGGDVLAAAAADFQNVAIFTPKDALEFPCNDLVIAAEGWGIEPVVMGVGRTNFAEL